MLSFLGRSSSRKSLGLMLSALMLIAVFGFASFEFVSAQTILTFKWKKNYGNMLTMVMPLAADLLPGKGLEIVVTGGSTTNDLTRSTAHGSVTVLNGTDGSLIWNVTGYPIGMHQPFEISDLNKDGIPEVIVSCWNEVIALHGNNGSLYWRAAAPSDDLTPAVADIDGDGYPEVFVSGGSAPATGYDWITSLSHDGNILHQAYSWHPCYGGLTIGDTNSDGKFELYQGDRSNSYGAIDDLYRGGGMGLRALDAHTLTPLWNDVTPLCSSHAPILADVDKDGVLDVIVADQNSGGVVVLNSADGSVVTTGGKYRKGGTNMPAHSAPTVYDVDGDGNLEIISCAWPSQVKVWDLYDWKLDAALKDESGNPLLCQEPPKVGDVTGDGRLDIIAVADSGPSNPYTNQRYSIYIYDYTYNIVHIERGVWDARSFTLVQDVDEDGYNELVLTSSGGTIYCYDTNAQAPTPPVRSVNQFYSERKCGAAEYVPPPIPAKPALRDEQPQDGSLNQTLNPTLSIEAVDFQGDLMSITFRTNASGIWQIIPPQYVGVSNGKRSVTPNNMNKVGTTYYWSVTATDGVNTAPKTYKFTTYSNAPTQLEPRLVSSSGANGSKESLTCYNRTTTDIDGDKVTNIYNWYRDGVSLTNLLLPFDTRTSNNPLLSDELFSDGFESGFENWNGNGVTDWDRDQTQKHSGSYSAHAGSDDNYLTSDNLDTSNAESITVSFWYRDNGIDDDDDVYLQFGNGSMYINIFELGNTLPEGMWHFYTVQTYDPRFLSMNFRIRFAASGIDDNEDLWIDDVSITAQIRTKDYSGYNNHGTVHGATWTSNGKVGGAYNFDGVNDFIRISDDPTLGGDGTWSQITIEFWIKPLANPSAPRGARILAKKVPSESSGSYIVGFQTSTAYPVNTLFFGVNNAFDGEWHEISASTAPLTNGNWHHVVCTYKSGQGLAIFINGTERAKSSTPFIGNIAPGPGESIHKQPLFIGYDGGGDQRRWLKGTLDEVRIYPQALSQYQILQRYLETKDGLSSNSTIAWQETNVGEVWKCQATPNDSFGDGQSKFSNTLTVLHSPSNNPPVASNLKIAPSTPHSTDDLIASYEYFDANGDPECNTEIRWYKNKVLQPIFNDSLIVPSSLTSKGQVWNFTVRPRDGADFGVLKWTSVTILNSPPSFADVYITPDPAFDTSTLTANPCGWFDPDSDPEGYAYQWQKLVNGNWRDISGQTSRTLSTQHFASGDYVRVMCTAYDGEAYGPSLLSRAQWVATFQSLNKPLLISSLGTNTTNEDLICYNHTDNQKTNIYNWYRNDVSMTNLLMPFDTNSATTAKDYSGRNNHGTVSDAIWASNGVVGGAYNFDGNDVITIQDAPSLGGYGTWSEISIEFCVNPSAEVYGTRIVARKVGSASTGSYMIGFQSSAPELPNTLFWGIETSGVWHDVSDADNWDPIKDGLVLAVGSWHHVFCTYKSGQGLTVFINGTERFSMPLTGNIDYDNGEQLFLGSDGSGSSTRYLNGILDEVRIYPKALSKEQIVQRYIETKDDLIASSTIVPEETEEGEVWKCQVTPNDSFGDGQTKFSNNLTIAPSVPPVQYQLIVEVRGSGTTVPAPSVHVYDENSVVSVEAVPDSGWKLSHWLLNGSDVGSANPYQITMNYNYNLTAIFIEAPPVKYQLVIEVVGSGTTLPSPGTYLYDEGTAVSVDAQPNSGWILDHWLLNGTDSGSADPYFITMNNSYHLTAIFEVPPVQYELVIEVRGNGTTDPAPSSYLYDEGTAVSVDAQPNFGWILSEWLLNGSIVGSVDPYPITMNSNYNLTAIFIEAPPVYIFESGFENGDFGEWDGTYLTSGESATVVQTLPNEGVYHARFTTDGSASTARTYCYKNIAGASELYALAYVNVDSGLPLSSWNALWLIQFRDASGSVIASYGVKADATGTKWALMYGSQTAYASSGPVANTWYSVEAYFNKTASGKTLTIYVDSQEAASLAVNTSGANDVAQVRVGITYNDPGYAFNIYIDTVTLDEQYIQPATYSVSLESAEDSGASSNLGTITIAGTSYNLPQNVSKSKGVYSAEYLAVAGYKFDRWETSGLVFMSDAYAVSTSITVSGDGTLRVNYSKVEGVPIFASGFETGNFGEWDGTYVTTGETATVVSTLPHDGVYHARFTTDGSASPARAYCYKNVAGVGELYTLAYVNVDSGLPLSSWNALWLIQFRDASGSVIASYGVKADALGTKWALMYGGQTAYATSGPQANTWYSVEAYFNKTAYGKSLIIYVDGQEAASLTVNTSGANNIAQVFVGIAYNDPSYTFNVYIDTVTIDDQYIQTTTYIVNLQSAEDTGVSSNLGTIAIAGTPYSLPQNIFKGPSVYSAEYVAAPGYAFDHWETTVPIVVSDAYAPSTTVTISGDGILKVIYFKVQGVPMFESGFETGNFSEWDGTSVTGGETASVVQTLPHDRMYHARFTTDGTASIARAYCYKNIAGASELYALAYVRFDGALPPLSSWNALWLIQFRDASGSVIASYGVKADALGTKWALMYGGQTAYASSGPQADTWYTVEAYFNKAASGETLAIYVNGEKVASLAINTSGANNVAQVRVGIAYNDPGYAFNIYIDTVTIDDQYI